MIGLPVSFNNIDLEDHDQYVIGLAKWRKVGKTNLFLRVFPIFACNTGNEWMNRLTTTDGLEITFDPLLLESENEDQAARNDRQDVLSCNSFKLYFSAVTLLMYILRKMVLIPMMSLAAPHPARSWLETGKGPLTRNTQRRWGSGKL